MNWPNLNVYNSFRELLRAGWLVNLFFDSNVPYIWRSNRWISEERFWDVFERVFSCDVKQKEFILFHENHAGWKNQSVCSKLKNGICLGQLCDVVKAMKEHAYYSRTQWSYGEKNDNYNLLVPGQDIFMSFTHSGEYICFSTSLYKLRMIQSQFRASRVVCWGEY